MLSLLGQSTVEPVTLTELRVYLRLASTDSTSEDALLKTLITAARVDAENRIKRALVPSTWRIQRYGFANTTETIELPRPPLSTSATAVAITYVEDTTAGVSTTIGATVYVVDADSEPGRVYPAYDNEWPDDVRDQAKSVSIQYASGYTTANPVPEAIKTWIKMRAACMYEYRLPGEAESDGKSHLDGLLDPYVIVGFAS